MPVRETFGLVPPASEFLLYLLFVPFAAAFVVGLYRRLRASTLRRRIAGGPGGFVGAIRRFARYALLQGRVAERARGWPHLAIFFGFLALLLATTVVALDWDIARPLGGRILAGTRYLYFEVLADAFGAAFVIGLATALAWRAAKLRRAGPDQRRMQWQFFLLIGGLLYMGVTGFLLESLRLVIDPVPWAGWSFIGMRLAHLLTYFCVGPGAKPFYVALWWSHALVAFTLIASLPYSAFLHAVAAPLNLMALPGRPRLEPSTPFDLRELEAGGNFDVKVGAVSIADLDPDLRFALNACTNCGRCDSVCPAVATGTALSPRRLVQTLRGNVMRKDWTLDLLATDAVSPDELWACTTCAACVEACPVFIRPVDYILPFRRELVSRQVFGRRQRELLDNLGRSANPYGLGTTPRSRLTDGLRAAPDPAA